MAVVDGHLRMGVLLWILLLGIFIRVICLVLVILFGCREECRPLCLLEVAVAGIMKSALFQLICLERVGHRIGLLVLINCDYYMGGGGSCLIACAGIGLRGEYVGMSGIFINHSGGWYAYDVGA